MKQKKLIFNFFVNRNWKKFADNRKRAKILANATTPLRPSTNTQYRQLRRLGCGCLRGFAARDGSAVKSHSTILQRLRRQISLDYYYKIPPATQASV